VCVVLVLIATAISVVVEGQRNKGARSQLCAWTNQCAVSLLKTLIAQYRSGGGEDIAIVSLRLQPVHAANWRRRFHATAYREVDQRTIRHKD